MTDAADYSAAYLAVRYFDEVSRASGGSGIKGLLQGIQNGTYANVTAAMADTAVSGSSGFISTGALSAAIGSADFVAFYNGVITEDINLDTGAIGGYYASGGTPMNAHSVVLGNGVYSMNPLAEFGWDSVKWPQGVSEDGGAVSLPGHIPAVLQRDNSLQSVAGTLLLHSNLIGNAGKMTVSGDENLIKALGFAEIQSARETVYDIGIMDAHSGDVVKSGVKTSGNILYGLLHDSIDIRLTNNFALDIDATRLKSVNDGYGSYTYSESDRKSFTVHIATNPTVLQIGANEGTDMEISFGDTGTAALGIERVNLRSRETAARSITIIDIAIDRLSTKRSRLGAYQNRLEHTMTNLTTASENTTASESRIRDTDMAKQTLKITQLRVLLMSSTLMLAQANQLPQSVLSLLG
ncbi:hypothetical protein FACS1894187_25210 [Synergistales bacterium]|nr:hypothetical protein FACS1894187_25210 [Synergistales bacterium]